jgi:hypothetical protein
MSEPAWRAEETEWHERESSRFQAEVAADRTVGEEADRLAALYLQGKLNHERLAD